MLELLKMVCQPVVLERDENGVAISEKVGEPVPIFTTDQFINFTEELRSQIAATNASMENGGGENRAQRRARKVPT